MCLIIIFLCVNNFLLLWNRPKEKVSKALVIQTPARPGLCSPPMLRPDWLAWTTEVWSDTHAHMVPCLEGRHRSSFLKEGEDNSPSSWRQMKMCKNSDVPSEQQTGWEKLQPRVCHSDIIHPGFDVPPGTLSLYGGWCAPQSWTLGGICPIRPALRKERMSFHSCIEFCLSCP